MAVDKVSIVDKLRTINQNVPSLKNSMDRQDKVQRIEFAFSHAYDIHDGTELCCSVSLVLYKRRGMDVISMLLNTDQKQASMNDRHKNYPLHIAYCM